MNADHINRTRACACSIAHTLRWNPTYVVFFAYELLVDANLHSEAEALRLAAEKNAIRLQDAVEVQTPKKETT